MRYALIAAALVGAVAASPAWAPPAYGGSDDGSWGSTSTVDSTTVVTVTSCGPEVTDCPGNTPPAYPVTTSSAAEVPPPAYETPSAPASSPYSPVTTSAVVIPPPAYSAPAPPASSPYSPVESSPAAPPVYSAPAPPASSPYSPVGTGAPAPPAYPSGPIAPPAYPIPGNGTWGPSPTASGAPSASEAYPVQQTGNSAAGLKAGSFLAGAGALAAFLL